MVSKKHFVINYSENKMEFDIYDKNLLFSIDKNNIPSLDNLEKTLRSSLKNPRNTLPLSESVKRGDNVLIIGDDKSRTTPTKTIIPVLLDELNSIKISDADIEILIANGTHRLMNGDEIIEKYGKEIVNRIKITNHDYTDQNNLINLGQTKSNLPIIINKKVLEADFVIGIGNISPHYYAGWSGGGKIIQPGVSGELTTAMTHLKAGMTKPIFSIVCNADCVVRKEIESVAATAGLKFIVNTVLSKEDRTAYLAVGDPRIAFREGVDFARKIFCPKILEYSDITIVSSFPYDLDYWQVDKSLTFASMATKPKGTVILVTPCFEGISPTHPSFEDKARLTYDELMKEIRQGKIEDLVAAAELLLHSQILERVKVIAVSHGLSQEEKEKMGFKHASSIDEALKYAIKTHGNNAKIGIMHRGDIVPTL